MAIQTEPLSPGLYFIATPIGAARDITLRALDILSSADAIAAEDTRTVKHLMRIHGIATGDRPVIAYHEHSKPEVRARLVRMIAEGRSVAYASEAGTPLVADPGFQLGRAAIEAGVSITAAPGPSALLAALTVSGLPTDRFMFAGFPPNTATARRKWLARLADCGATLAFYESPKRVGKLLMDLVQTFGSERQGAVCRELTKRFEEVSRGTLDELAAMFEARNVKGEIVVLVERAPDPVADADTMEAALRVALREQSVKDAAATVAADLGLAKRLVYQAALAMEKER